MLGFGKRSGSKKMKDLLIKVQGQLAHDGLGQEMRKYQYAFVDQTKTFIAFSESFEREGMSAAGGLAQYCKNAFEKTMEPIDNGGKPIPIVIDLAEKMTYVALSIERVVSDDDLTDKDKTMIRDAKIAAHKWLSHDARVELLRLVEQRLQAIEDKYNSDGMLASIKNGGELVNMMMAW